jgi:hypothetical protein
VPLGNTSQVLCCIDCAGYMPQVLTLNIDGHDLYEEEGGKALFFHVSYFSCLKHSLKMYYSQGKLTSYQGRFIRIGGTSG